MSCFHHGTTTPIWTSQDEHHQHSKLHKMNSTQHHSLNKPHKMSTANAMKANTKQCSLNEHYKKH